MPVRRLGLLTCVLAGALAALAPAIAHAGEGCPERMRCLTVTVPLDRSGGVPGALELPVAVERGRGPILLMLGGGPGQGMIVNGDTFVRTFGPLVRHRIAVLDQRGTGATALDCPRLQGADLTDFTPPPPGAARACGERLGPARAFYTTTDTVADLEEVRRALGVERWALYGVSYGTYVVERYARAHPDRVSALVLDSVVPQENVDPLLAPNMARSRTILRQLCARGACRGVTADVVGDVARLVRRMAKRPLTGRVALGDGTARSVRVDSTALFDLFATLTSFRPDLLTTFPAAVASALDGDEQPLLRLYAVFRTSSAAPPLEIVSWGLHTATLCSDVPFPWGSPASDPARRPAAVRAAAARLSPARLAPFDRLVAAGNGVVATCEAWPVTRVVPPPAPGPLPGVPTLILAGGFDLSTPVSAARREARRSTTASLEVIRYGGHSLAGTQACARTIMQRFFARERLGRPCAGLHPPQPVPAPALPRGGRARQARAAVQQTLADVERIAGTGLTRFGGLRAGSFRIDDRGVTLRRDELIRGAPVSGRLATLGGPGTLTVGGRVDARVRIDERGRMHVRLLGRALAGAAHAGA